MLSKAFQEYKTMKKTLVLTIIFTIVTQNCQSTSSAKLECDSISAASAAVICADNGRVIFEKNAYEKRPMASTTKIMTSLLAVEAADADDRDVAITNKMVPVEGSSMGLKIGNVLPISSLAKGMLTVSGNDAANSVAIALGGSLELFSDMMNEKAKIIGMKDTHFVTPSGLDDKEHYSTAYDMALLGAYALENRSFFDICSKKKVDVLYKEPNEKRVFYNENKMLKRYDGCIGIKTGFTKSSGRCLVSGAQRNNLRLVAVTLNAPDDWNDHEKMLDYGFSVVESVTLNDNSIIKVPIVGAESESIDISIEQPIKAIINKGEASKLKKTVLAPKFAYAPIKKGQILGKIEYTLNGKVIAENNLLAKENVNYQKNKKMFKFKNLFKNLLIFK